MDKAFWMGIPKLFADASFTNFVDAVGVEEALVTCEEFAGAFRHGMHKGLYLYGPAGCGKTHLAAAILNYIGDKAAKFQDVHRLARLMTDPKRENWAQDPLESCIDATVLLLDGVDGKTAQEHVETIIRARYNALLPTIITSTLPWGEELAGVFGEGLWSRLNHMCQPVRMVGEDIRRSMATTKTD